MLMCRNSWRSLTVFFAPGGKPIQQYQDRQKPHDLANRKPCQQILAYSLDYPDWTALKNYLDVVRAQVQAVFDQVFSLSRRKRPVVNSLQLWSDARKTRSYAAYLVDYVSKQQRPALPSSSSLKKRAPAIIARLSAKGAKVLDRLMPKVIRSDASTLQIPMKPLKRLLALFEAVAGRNVIVVIG